VQRKWFARQFDLVRGSGLPVFLHMRAAADDMLKVLQQQRASFGTGVVHSFDGTIQEAHSILSLQGLYIGVQPCGIPCSARRISTSTITSALRVKIDPPSCRHQWLLLENRGEPASGCTAPGRPAVA
jgi:TatD DNase family protein